MGRERHGHERQPQPPANFQVDHRERDGDAGFALDHVVQEAVARVEVVVLIPLESFNFEELAIEHREPLGQRHPQIRGIGDRIRRRIEPCEVRARIEVRVRVGGERERDTGDIEHLVRLGHEGFEARSRWFGHVGGERIALLTEN